MAVRLQKKREPYWMKQGPIMESYGVRLKVKPQDGAIQSLMQTTAAKELRELVEAVKKVKEEGGKVVGLLDLTDPVIRESYFRVLQRKHAALHAIVEWEGILAASDDPNDQTPAPINEQTITDFINLPGIGIEFERLYDEPIMEMMVERNFSTPAPSGTTEAGENTVPSANGKDSLAPMDNGESTGSSVPTSQIH
jgi:hypothetical protein